MNKWVWMPRLAALTLLVNAILACGSETENKGEYEARISGGTYPAWVGCGLPNDCLSCEEIELTVVPDKYVSVQYGSTNGYLIGCTDEDWLPNDLLQVWLADGQEVWLERCRYTWSDPIGLSWMLIECDQ